MSALIYLIGYPGSGKTTAMAQAMGVIDRVELQPFAHTVYADGLIQLGRARDVYGGTDTLSLSVQPRVIDWIGESVADVIVGEGDRLANSKFFTAVEALGRDVRIVYLKCPEVIARRRAWERGSRFNESWLKGRITKVDRLVEEWKHRMVALDSTEPEIAIRQLKDIVQTER